jgi:putative ABC transport system permease protein
VVIGVVGDVRYTGLDEAAGNEFYLPEGLYPQAAITLLVRTTRDPLDLYPGMRRRIEGIDPDAFVFDVKPMTGLIAESLSPRRFSTIMLSMFAAIALILSLAGIYAVIAHAVAQRTTEIGIRAALGASAGQVTGLMLRDGLVPAAVGLIAGWLGVLAIARFFSAMLFGVGVIDLSTWTLVSVAMLVAAAIASYVPARRACAVDPAVALRAE